MSSIKAQIIGSLLVLCLVGGCATTAVKESTPSNSIKEHSVWQGTFHQVGWKDPYPMILFINSRAGDAFEATTWYPTLRNGLLTVSGQIKPDGVITFTEEEIIYHEGNILSETIYTGILEGNTLKGPSTIYDRKAGDFILKLAD